MMAPEFLNEQLALIRRTFFAKTVEKQWFQESDLIRQAIAFPAAHLKERYGATADDRMYRQILRTVIDTIVAKGNRSKIDRFSVYFLHCVQKHMQHHGEEYHIAAKAARRLVDLLPAATRGAEIVRADRTTEVLVDLHRTLKSRAGRKKKATPAEQASLF
jgi:hypothetical protein